MKGCKLSNNNGVLINETEKSMQGSHMLVCSVILCSSELRKMLTTISKQKGFELLSEWIELKSVTS